MIAEFLLILKGLPWLYFLLRSERSSTLLGTLCRKIVWDASGLCGDGWICACNIVHYVISGNQRMTCALLATRFLFDFSTSYQCTFWSLSCLINSTSLVGVFIKLILVLAIFLEEDSVLLWVFQLCYVPIRAIFWRGQPIHLLTNTWHRFISIKTFYTSDFAALHFR